MYRFTKGESVPLNKDTMQQVLDPYVTARDPESGFLRITAGTDGGEAEIYTGSEESITINRFGGDEVMNVISDLLRRLEAVLVLPGGTVILSRDEDREHLPRQLQDEWSVVVAPTGPEIARAIRVS
jgi:hypothetical protein